MSMPARAVRPSPRRWLLPLLVLAALGGGAWWFFSGRGQDPAAGFAPSRWSAGTIRIVISATGTLSATTTVDVGSQVSGSCRQSRWTSTTVVKAGQAIARLDPAPLQTRSSRRRRPGQRAALGLGEAQATRATPRPTTRARPTSLAAPADRARRCRPAARAARDQARARIASAQAQVRQQQASVSNARWTWRYSVIRSPVDGVVLLRAVEPGQTVAASLQTPVLFKIADDLAQMQIVLAIDEADIGQVREGLLVRFTVDAFPERNFTGRVRQVRLAATNTANVITYPVVVDVENPEQLLLPGMTANAEIEISRKPDVLSVPNAALRFRPAEESTAAGPPGMAPNRNAAAGASASGNLGEDFARIAAGLGLDARQQAAFDAAAEQQRERGERMRAQAQASAGAAAGSSGAGIAGIGGSRRQDSGRNGQGSAGNRAGRAGERMKQAFAGFRATLSAAQQAQWDAALRRCSAAASVRRCTGWSRASPSRW